MRKRPKKYVSGGLAFREKIRDPPIPSGGHTGNKPATPKQIQYLVDLGMAHAEATDLSNWQASQEIQKRVDLPPAEVRHSVVRDPGSGDDTQTVSIEAGDSDSMSDDIQVSADSLRILRMIAQGFSFNQILRRCPELCPRDIFDAAKEVVDLFEDPDDVSSNDDVDEIEIPF